MWGSDHLGRVCELNYIWGKIGRQESSRGKLYKVAGFDVVAEDN